MKLINISTLFTVITLGLLLTIAPSCSKDEKDEFPITNDFRVLQVKIDNKRIDSGVSDISVIPSFELVFSHGVNDAAFEAALNVSPAVNYTVSYDDSKSFATFDFSPPLQYETAYTILLPKGTYGAGGEQSIDDFIFEFTTAAFEPPAVALTSNVVQFFEGDTARVTATINRAIIEEISMDLVFGGSAIGPGTDFLASATTITIPAGTTSATIELIAVADGETEGEETIIVTLQNLVNVVKGINSQLELFLADLPPVLELKGVMELQNYIGGSSGRVRAIHLRVLDDIPNLGIYGVEIASNGADPNPMDIEFTFPDMTSASAGDDLFIVRDQDEMNAQAYFEDCFNEFTVFTSDRITQNGDDAILLYKNGVAIESFGQPGVDGTGEFWEYSNSWAYKIRGEWIYAGVDCSESNGGETNATSPCAYPFCSAIQLQGVSSLLWDGSGTNGGKFVHVRANRDISDLSQYSLGVANNGGGTDGIEFTFPIMSAYEGDHILVAREPATIASYLGSCFDKYDIVLQADAMTQNGDDAIELFDGDVIIETYGDANMDGTGQPWEYAGSWAYKIGAWIVADIDCGAGSTSTQSSPCPYEFCN